LHIIILSIFAVGKVVPAPGSQSALTDHTEQGEPPAYDVTQTTGFHSNEVMVTAPGSQSAVIELDPPGYEMVTAPGSQSAVIELDQPPAYEVTQTTGLRSNQVMTTAPGSQSAVVDHNQLDQPPPPYYTTQPTRLHRNEMVVNNVYVETTSQSNCCLPRSIKWREDETRPKSYLQQSILTMLFCCFCLGFVGLMFSLKVRSERKAGNLARARKSSRSAYVWAKSASVAGVTIYITAAILLGLGVLLVVGAVVIGILVLIICLC
jgi:hypothetical protein